jgi:hypothetical protein
MRGMAIMYARAACQSLRPDVMIVSSAQGIGSDPQRTDALSWYNEQFIALGMTNANSGLDTLRHSYTLLLSLGMQESSGQHCVGRDRSADFSSADSAEAGIFQTSWGANRHSPVLGALFDQYNADRSKCLLDVFQRGVRCTAWDARTWGEGKGAEWQQLTKACPAFATDYAAVLIRLSGGNRGEFGPLRRRKAELRRDCDAMFSQVQALVQSQPLMCAGLN